jgi:Zn-dependent protease
MTEIKDGVLIHSNSSSSSSRHDEEEQRQLLRNNSIASWQRNSDDDADADAGGAGEGGIRCCCCCCGVRDCRVAWSFVALCAATLLMAAVLCLTEQRSAMIIFVLLAWCCSVCAHEFAHSLVAYHGGDRSVRDKGYLRLDVLAYTHVLYSIVLPLVVLFLGGLPLTGAAVYIEHTQLRSRCWRSSVALAGPAMTLLCGAVLSLLFVADVPAAAATSSLPLVLWEGVAFLVYLEYAAFVLNMLPLPPLDGYGALEPWLPARVRTFVKRHYTIISWCSLILILALFWALPFVRSAVLELCAVSRVPMGLVLSAERDFTFYNLVTGA